MSRAKTRLVVAHAHIQLIKAQFEREVIIRANGSKCQLRAGALTHYSLLFYLAGAKMAGVS
jgi:hypothetical protein